MKKQSDKITVDQYRAMMETRHKAEKPGKYKNVKVFVDGIKFDSRKEAAYYGQLLIRQRLGEIIGFKRQVRYDLIVNGVKVGYYKADFVEELAGGGIQVIDVKSDFTRKMPMFRKNKKLMLALYSINIIEK